MAIASKAKAWADLSTQARTILFAVNSYKKDFAAVEAVTLAKFGIHMLTRQQPNINPAALIDEVAYGLYVWFDDGDQDEGLLAYFKHELLKTSKRI